VHTLKPSHEGFLVIGSDFFRNLTLSHLQLQGVHIYHVGPVDLTVAAGECVCLAGPSGAGKTLLLRAITDLEPHQGHVFIDGVECNRFSGAAWRRQVGLLPAESHWWLDDVGGHFSKVEDNLLHMLGFANDVLHWRVRRLSTGERQRLALARLLCLNPKVLLLDEPTASLDPDNVRRVEEVITYYRTQHAAAVLWVSHDPEQTKRMASRAYSLSNGKLMEAGEPCSLSH